MVAVPHHSVAWPSTSSYTQIWKLWVLKLNVRRCCTGSRKLSYRDASSNGKALDTLCKLRLGQLWTRKYWYLHEVCLKLLHLSRGIVDCAGGEWFGWPKNVHRCYKKSSTKTNEYNNKLVERCINATWKMLQTSFR